ncbi:MAG TPA: hypothetical protein PLC34_10495 [Burkholderiaceae bacterium]|nr:hypothetical protein [Burkholderiaceae bacterium]
MKFAESDRLIFTAWLRVAAVALLSLMLTSCTSTPDIAAKARVFGIAVDTKVDSDVARYYLEQHLQGTHSNPVLTDAIERLHTVHGQGIPTREELRKISHDFSVDFASLFLVHQLLKDECNRQINADFQRLLSSKTAQRVDTAPYMVLFMPGWDYADIGTVTGADFAQPRKLVTALGMENHLVGLPPTGSVEDNAKVLSEAIALHARTGKHILIAGASSSGPAIHLALGEKVSKDNLKSVKAWLNLGGILQGSPLVDYLQLAPQRWLFNSVVWFKGWDPQAIQSMSAKESRPRFQRLRIDSDLLVVNYLGVPLSGQLSQYSRDKYPLLKSDGPNDGLTLLTDVIAPNSLTIVALGSDHFFAEDPAINAKTVALMELIVSYMNVNVKRPPANGLQCGLRQ